MISQRLFTFLLLAGITATIAGCGHKKEEAVEADAPNRVAVELHPIQRQNVSDPIYASGLLFSDEEARLSFKTGGVIQKIYVREGDAVRQGQLLATLDLTEIEAQVNQARQGLDKANRDLERARNLQRDNVATREQVQNAETAYEVAGENVRIAEFNRRFSEIRAPHTGRIVRKLMNEGELAGPGTPVFFIDGQGKADWVLRAGVADRDWARIAEGDPASITLDAYPGETFPGKVTYKSVAADPSSGSFEIEVTIRAGNKNLASGLFARAALQPGAGEALVCVPPAAVHEGSGKSAYVYVTDDRKTARKLAVRIASIRPDCIAIEQGLDGVSEVITAGSPFLTDGSAIEVMEAHSQKR